MNTNEFGFNDNISATDPRVTAYALGELEGDELKRIEAAVNADPELKAAVAELRAFGGQLGEALGEEPVMDVPVAKADDRASAPKRRRGQLIPFPLHYFATAVAACFAVVVWVRQDKAAPSFVATTTESDNVGEVHPVVGLTGGARQDADVSFDSRLAELPAPPPEPLRMTYAEFKKMQDAAPAPLPSVEPGALSMARVSEPVMRFDQSLGVFGGSAEAGMAKRAPVEATTSSAVAPFDQEAHRQFIAEQKDRAKLEAEGRRQYLAGDIEGAKQTFSQVLVINPDDPVAKSFTSRIEHETTRIAALNRARARGQLVQTVSEAWSRPSRALPVVAISASRGESYAHPGDTAFRSVSDAPLSTFSIDVDTASYSNVRRFITGGRLPLRGAVRVEELINYFPYRYASPRDGAPFAAHLATEMAPWNPQHRVVRIALKGRELTAVTRPSANLVFLIDVSGSMSSANRLPLVKESLRLLVERLRADDRVAIVTYAGGSGLTLPSTPASRKHEILAALDALVAQGSTNGGMGIHLAYDIAKANFVPGGGINRVILCTDGDFNVGVTSRDELVRLIEEKARSRVFLSVFGFGMGNLKDATLEALSAKGNGTYGYIDSRREAEKVFVEQVEGTLATIAKDVKVQVEFNPARVAAYRLIGYENRMLKKEDFNNDAVDAGDVGAGHTVTALYEIVPVGAETGGGAAGGADGRPVVDPLKYQTRMKPKADDTEVVPPSAELLTVKIRYKAPEGDVSAKLEFPLTDSGEKFAAQADIEFRFAMAVAAWGMLLTDSPHKGVATFEQVLELAEDGLRNDPGGHRAEFLQLVRRSAELGR